MPDVEYVSRDLTWTASDRLVAATDDLLEATSPTEELFGVDRLKQLIVSHVSADASELLDVILTAVRGFTGNRPLQDDLTLLVASPRED